MADDVLLEGRGLVKRYGGVVAVDQVDVSVARGECLGLVGPNGAGKTTLVDLVTGAQAADAGTLELAGSPLRGTAARRARVGLARTFQYPQLALDLTVRENLLLGAASARMSSLGGMVLSMLRGFVTVSDKDVEERIRAVADELSIERIERRAEDLTLGEQRLVEVARALLRDPQVLLLDEPFAGADERGIEGIREAIETVRRRRCGVILVDHNVDLVAAIVDRIMLLNEGAVAFDGAPDECLQSEEMQRVYFGVDEEADDVA